MTKALVLLSGGVDSTTTLYYAANAYGRANVSAVSFDYGQRHIKELEVARKLFVQGDFGGKHHIVKIPYAQMEVVSALTDGTREIPKVSYAEIEGISPAYVPFRNGTMIALATAVAASNEIDIILAGPHAEDAENWAYPDCTLEFMGAMANAVYVGTYHKQRLLTPLLFMSKDEVVTMGMNLGAPLYDTWSCYIGGDKHCGVCPTCRARQQAFSRGGWEDHTDYAA